jgi:hypothetical protein
MTGPCESDKPSAREGISTGQFWLRILWVAAQLIVAFWFAERGNLFFYQRF